MTEGDFTRRVMAMRNQLWHVGRAMLWNDEDAADAVQEAMLLASISDISGYTRWLSTPLAHTVPTQIVGSMSKTALSIQYLMRILLYLKLSSVQRWLERRHIFCFSAAAMSSSLKSGCAILISSSARCHVVLPGREAMPYSVTINGA